MDILSNSTNLILHIDVFLAGVISTYGVWTYYILFLTIFLETGILFAALLPGNSLLIAAGTLAAATNHTLNIHLLFITLTLAAICGSTLNYFLGLWVGPQIFNREKSALLNQERIEKTHHLYERIGGKLLVIAFYLPIIRTFTPFIAGIADMSRMKFFFYTVVGAIMWIGIILYSSYLLGNIPAIKEHFSLIIISVIAVSFIPALLEFKSNNHTKR